MILNKIENILRNTYIYIYNYVYIFRNNDLTDNLFLL